MLTGPVQLEGQLPGAIGPRQRVGGLPLEGVGDAPVQAGALRRQEVGVDHLADERVAEAIGPGVVIHHQQVGVHRGADRRLQRRIVQPDDGLEQVVAGLPSDRRDRAEHLPGRLVEGRDIGGDQVGEHDGDRLSCGVRRHELLREERVALAASDDLVDELRRRRAVAQAFDARPHRARSEALELEAHHVREAGERGEPAPLRTGADLVGPVGADQHDALVDEVPGQELEQVQRDGIGPVEVLEADDHDVGPGEVGDEVEDGGEEAGAAVAPTARVRSHPAGQRCQLVPSGQDALGAPVDLPEEIGQRGERDRATPHLDAAADVQRHLAAGRALAQDRGLADARIAGDEQHHRSAGPGARHGALERRQLPAAPDEPVAAGALEHGAQVSPPTRSEVRCPMRAGGPYADGGAINHLRTGPRHDLHHPSNRTARHGAHGRRRRLRGLQLVERGPRRGERIGRLSAPRGLVDHGAR